MMNQIEYIDRAFLAEDFIPQFDNSYYKKLLQHYLCKIYNCKKKIMPNNQEKNITTTQILTHDYSKLKKNIDKLLNLYNKIVNLYIQIHNERKHFEDKLKTIIGEKLNLKQLNELQFNLTTYNLPDGSTDYDSIKNLLALGKILLDRIEKMEKIIKNYLKININP
jgi:hypothetical protein